MNFFVSIIFIALSIFWFLLLTGVVCFSYDKHSFNINLVVILFCFVISCYNLNIININNIVTWKFLFASFILLGFITFIFILKDSRLDVLFLYFSILLGSLIIVYNNHLIIIYLGLELQTFSLFLLISKNRWFLKGSEASLKYFILSALASGFYLLGLTFFYSLGISLDLREISFLNFSYDKTFLGIIIILFSLFFKLGLFPFQFWLADIYEGSSWDIIGLIAIIPKVSVLSIIIKLTFFINIFIWIGVLSIITGTLSAINQSKIKRMLAYSSVSHMGFILLGFSLNCQEGFEISLIYWIIYMISFLGLLILGFITTFSNDYNIVDLTGLYNINKLAAFSWSILFISIAGIPPLSGFIAKWFILVKLISFNYLFLSIICILFSIISAGYYLRIIQMMFFHPRSSFLVFKQILDNNDIKNYNLMTFLLGFYLFFILFFIINPNPWILFIHYCLSFFN